MADTDCVVLKNLGHVNCAAFALVAVFAPLC